MASIDEPAVGLSYIEKEGSRVMPHRRVVVLLVVTALAMWSAAPAAASSQKAESTSSTLVTERTLKSAKIASLRVGIDFWRRATWDWQFLMGKPKTPSSFHERWVRGSGYLRWIAELWVRGAAQAKKQAQNPPHKADWLCIQSGIKNGRWSTSLKYLGGGYRVKGHGEGSWTTDGPKYDGGLQMDAAFQRKYGGWLLKTGPAYRWKPYAQMWVGERAYQTRGFHPWPNTARACGLI